MIRQSISAVFLAASIFTFGQASAIQPGVAATVEGHQIMETALQSSIDQYMQEQGGNIGAVRYPDELKEVREKILNVLIGQKLLWHAASEANLTVDDETLDRAYDEFVSRFENREAFELKMKQAGYTEEVFRNNLREKLSSQRWLQNNVLNKVSVSDQEVGEFYEENKNQFIDNPKINASHILIQVPDGADEARIKESSDRISDLKEQLDDGADFAELAKLHSEDSSAAKGGELGYFEKGVMVAPFEKAAFGLDVGEVSDIVRSPYGFHIIKLNDRKPARQIQLTEIGDRIHAYLMQEKSRQAIEDAVDGLRKDAEIEIRAF